MCLNLEENDNEQNFNLKIYFTRGMTKSKMQPNNNFKLTKLKLIK